jgi:hypothetical protein
MGNKSVFEATVLRIYNINGSYGVVVSPCKYERHYQLDSKHPNFIDLYNKCKTGSTYRFETKHMYILNMSEPQTHYITGTVKGILDITTEYKILSDYNQLVLDTHTPHRILIKKDQSVNTTNKYKFYYQKAFGDNLFKILKYEIINY